MWHFISEVISRCWWEDKMLMPVWKSVWHFPINIDVLDYDTTILFLCIFPREMKIQWKEDAGESVTTSSWIQPRFLSKGDQRNRLSHTKKKLKLLINKIHWNKQLRPCLSERSESKEFSLGDAIHLGLESRHNSSLLVNSRSMAISEDGHTIDGKVHICGSLFIS